MERIKSFDIQAQPTGRSNRDLSALVDETINGWLEEHPEADNIRISHAASPGLSFPRAFVIITYEVAGIEEDIPTEVLPEDVQGNSSSEPQEQPVQEVPEVKRRRGRPPQDK